MSQQASQAFERRVVGRTSSAPRESRFDRVETCNLQAVNEGGVDRRRAVHDPMVPVAVVAAELQTQEAAGFPSVQTLESAGVKALVLEGMRMAGLNHGQVCAFIGNRRGGPYDQSQWTKALESGDLPLDRMLANLPLTFWRPVITRMQAWAGMKVDHSDVADIAFESVAMAFVMVGEALRRRAG
jgi:hypothetical protein